MRCILLTQKEACIDWGVERWPARPRVELGLGAEKGEAAGCASIDSLFVAIPVLVPEGGLRPPAEDDRLLLGCQLSARPCRPCEQLRSLLGRQGHGTRLKKDTKLQHLKKNGRFCDLRED